MNKKTIKKNAIELQLQEALNYIKEENLDKFYEDLDFWWIPSEKFYWVDGSGMACTHEDKNATLEFQVCISFEDGKIDYWENYILH
ncbi:hypothetical protein [Bulleidia sp. zg-1006]|uniref:hypothetical protein n=1 Tax=Bulleidia sp. zg-1006 TaxID=2806552 RepID=UPI001939426F|nr:hypothetical protein [Bulleidia sp. zg-1006]QRG86068.1 hypothetical protein JOS54_04125 [Bulleidia sp. zg-1006]